MKMIKIAAIAALLVAPTCMASQVAGPSQKSSWFSSFKADVIETVDDEINSISLRYNIGDLRWNDTDCLIIEGILAATVLYVGYKLIRKVTRKKHHDRHHKDD